MNRADVSILIPTCNRHDILKRLLKSLNGQTLPPTEVIIVDASIEKIPYDFSMFSNLFVRYLQAERPSLTAQRNTAIEAASDKVGYFCFLDDDTELAPDAIEAMFTFLRSRKHLYGGAVFNIVNERPTRMSLIKKIFMMGSSVPGQVLCSGFNTKLTGLTMTLDVQWLCGGVTIWRRDVFSEFRFDEWYEGYGYCEDLDFSYRVGKKYPLAAVAQARVYHYPLPARKRKNMEFGLFQVVNRYYFLRKHSELSKSGFYWASVGQFLENLVFFIIRLDLSYALRAAGNTIGVCSVLRGKLIRVG